MVARCGLPFTRLDDNDENRFSAIDFAVTAATHALGAQPSSVNPRRALRPVHTSAATEAVFDELRPQFEGQLPTGVVRDYVARAAADLEGSISREALPEMVIRLAAVRLERLLRPERPDGETHHAHQTGSMPATDRAQRSEPAGRPFTLPAVKPP